MTWMQQQLNDFLIDSGEVFSNIFSFAKAFPIKYKIATFLRHAWLESKRGRFILVNQ
jgi:hypothetical protein